VLLIGWMSDTRASSGEERFKSVLRAKGAEKGAETVQKGHPHGAERTPHGAWETYPRCMRGLPTVHERYLRGAGEVPTGAGEVPTGGILPTMVPGIYTHHGTGHIHPPWYTLLHTHPGYTYHTRHLPGSVPTSGSCSVMKRWVPGLMSENSLG